MTMTCISTGLHLYQFMDKLDPGITDQPVVNIRAAALFKVVINQVHSRQPGVTEAVIQAGNVYTIPQTHKP